MGEQRLRALLLPLLRPEAQTWLQLLLEQQWSRWRQQQWRKAVPLLLGLHLQQVGRPMQGINVPREGAK